MQPINVSVPKGQLIKPQFRMICAFSAQCCVVNVSPNVPFAALALRWAIDGLGFQPVFCGATKLTQMNPNKFPARPATNTSRLLFLQQGRFWGTTLWRKRGGCRCCWRSTTSLSRFENPRGGCGRSYEDLWTWYWWQQFFKRSYFRRWRVAIYSKNQTLLKNVSEEEFFWDVFVFC